MIVHDWLYTKWEAGWGWSGSGKKGPDGNVITLQVFLQQLERDGWEIFAIHPQCRSSDVLVVCRR